MTWLCYPVPLRGWCFSVPLPSNALWSLCFATAVSAIASTSAWRHSAFNWACNRFAGERYNCNVFCLCLFTLKIISTLPVYCLGTASLCRKLSASGQIFFAGSNNSWRRRDPFLGRALAGVVTLGRFRRAFINSAAKHF